ncbi:hypothetical protein [Pyrodictium abyssi]|uniref:Glycosyltransferase RgtA/B/C/D-like domain-containing protein n=1 Tax=Pyrodictium abyssi TaxID=54256 RepID=A0ABM8IYE5_9CREN|nr:hypothetical protein PABY_14910 [Pyrodictium abyssi]
MERWRVLRTLQRSGLLDTAAGLLVGLYASLLFRGLVAGSGLPSFEHGVFRDANIAFYISYATMIDAWGSLCVPTWFGFFDTVRFYPPLGNMLIYLLGAVLDGDYVRAAMLAYMVVLVAFVSGFYTLIYTLTGSRLAGLLAALLLPLVHGYASTIALYWEYNRLLGEAFMFHALARLHAFMERGDRRLALSAAAYMALVLLSNLVAFIEALALALATVMYWARRHLAEGAGPEELLYLAQRLALASLFFLGLTLWWLAPAIAPYGLGHYLRIKTPLGFKARVVALALQSGALPPLWSPAVQLPLLVAGAVALIIHLLLRSRGSVLAYYAAALAVLIAVYGQGLRLLPSLGAVLAAAVASLPPAVAERVGGRYRWVAAAAAMIPAMLLAGFYLGAYLGVYSTLLRPDYSFMGSDEYRVAVWLRDNLPEGCKAYLMHGPRFRGGMWVNVFAPRVEQVLGGYVEGALPGVGDEYLRLDYIIKETGDWYTAYQLMKKLGVVYLVVDRAWMESHWGSVVERLEKRGLIEPVDEVNKQLGYSMVYRVVNATCTDGSRAPGLFECLALPSRIVGAGLSAASMLLFARWLRRLED